MATLEQIKTLREKTGAGLGACKAALLETNDDVEAAIVSLRKKGLADMAKRAGRETKEGRTVIKISADGKTYAMASLGCETDFVAKTPDFLKLTETIADYMLAHTGVEDFTADETLGNIIKETAHKFGENVSFTKAACWQAKGDNVINYYLHSDYRKSALVELSYTGACDGAKKAELASLAREIAMQSVGMVAQYLDETQVPADVIEKEKDIAVTQAKNEGKPEAAIEKMIPGRIKKFFKDVCLLDQPCIKDNKVDVRTYVDQKGKELGLTIKVERFVRF